MAKKEGIMELEQKEIEQIQEMFEKESEHLETQEMDIKIKNKEKSVSKDTKDIGIDKFIDRGKEVKCNGNSYRILPIMIEDLDIFYKGLLYIPMEEDEKKIKLTDWGVNSIERYRNLFNLMVSKYCVYNDKLKVTPELQKDLCWGLDEIKMFLTNWVEVSE